MCQALTTGGKSQTGSYPYSQGWEFLGVNRHPMWRRHFYDLGANIQKMNEIAEEKGNRNAILIGRTIMLMSTMMTTDAFGAMPLSEVYKSNSPKYDSQAEIYEWMFNEVDELLKLYQDPTWIKCPTNLLINQKMDRIYAGDMQKWEAFCKALKARLWLRKLPNWDNTPTVCQEIVRLVDDALATWEEPRYYYPGGVTESNCPWGPYAPKINSWESRDNRLDESIPTAFFLHGILGGFDIHRDDCGYALDPRATKIMEPRMDPADSKKIMPLKYLESNIGMDINLTLKHFPDLLTQSSLTNPYVSNTGYIALLTTEELKFIKAEAQYWAGDINGAYNTTVEATVDNMKRYGIDRNTMDADGKDYNPARQYDRFFRVKLSASEFTIADLMQQKYVAMYLQPEQWTDMRRYNYSSSANGISYNGVFVYDVKKVHNGKPALFAKDDANLTITYSLHRPYNLYEAYWCTPEDYGKNATLSPNAWVNRLNADTETETKYNKKELEKNDYYTTNAAGEKILDYRVLKRRMIWAYNTCGMAISADPDIEWM